MFAIEQFRQIREAPEKPIAFKCAIHKNKSIEFLCTKDQELICNECFDQHKEHANMLERMNQDMIIQKAKNMVQEIEKEEKKLRDCKDKLSKIVDKESVPSNLIIEYLD